MARARRRAGHLLGATVLVSGATEERLDMLSNKAAAAADMF
jgi:hypothetical protein